MKKIAVIGGSFFGVLGVIFSFLPLGTIALLPIGLALILGVLALKTNETTDGKLPKIIVGISLLCLLYVLGKFFFVKDEVVVDQQFEQQKIEQKEEAKQELEELEGDLE